MSRCLPFPPPGYVRIVATGDALIDSIKPHKEKENAQTDRKRESKTKCKDHKTVKKESRKVKDKNGEKKEKKHKRMEKHGDGPELKKRKISDIFHEVKKNQLGPKENSLQKKHEEVAEQLEKSIQKKPVDLAEPLEKSCLTEEHQQLNSTNLCYSSDGTQSGDKRKRDSLPSTSNQSNGSIIRIRMSTSKQKIAEAPLSQGQECAKSVKLNPSSITQLPVQKQYATASIPATIATKEEVTRRPDPDLMPSTSGKNHTLPADSVTTSSKSKSADKKLLKKENLYKALTLNWAPIPLLHDQAVADEDDQDWLFKSKSGDDHNSSKRVKACNDSPFQDSCSYGPHACYLPEVDIYALPYVMPF